MFRYLLIALIPALLSGFSNNAAAFFGDDGVMQEAKTALRDDYRVDVSERFHFIRFWPRDAQLRSDHCFVFYPGASVDAAAYAPLTRALAEAGYPSYILKIPGEFPLIAPFAADYAKLDSHHACTQYLIGGHSLGGTAAAIYVDHHPEDDLLLLASYPAETTDISDQSSRVLSIYASEDGLTTEEDIERSLPNLPADVQLLRIEGGNHAQFGWYGEQRGDGRAYISREQQQSIVIEETLILLE